MVVVAGVDVGKANLDVSISRGSGAPVRQHGEGHYQVAETPYGAGRHHDRV